MPAAGRPEGTGNDEGTGMQARLAALEQSVRAMADEIRTRRLVVVDDLGRVRLVTEVIGETTELRLELPGGAPGDRATGPDDGAATRSGAGRAAVVLHATPSTVDGPDDGLGPAVGIQLWADGDSVVEIDSWPGPDGRWQPHVHLTGGA
jgi:hypothetical protein